MNSDSDSDLEMPTISRGRKVRSQSQVVFGHRRKRKSKNLVKAVNPNTRIIKLSRGKIPGGYGFTYCVSQHKKTDTIDASLIQGYAANDREQWRLKGTCAECGKDKTGFISKDTVNSIQNKIGKSRSSSKSRTRSKSRSRSR